MATVYIGGASIDERGKASGGQAGNQSGRELRRQAYYDHAKEWYVFRAKSPAVREDIALAMERAIANRNIGYDQLQNQTLWNQIKGKGYDPARATSPCETDCARLVRVCVAYGFNENGLDASAVPDWSSCRSLPASSSIWMRVMPTRFSPAPVWMVSAPPSHRGR